MIEALQLQRPRKGLHWRLGSRGMLERLLLSRRPMRWSKQLLRAEGVPCQQSGSARAKGRGELTGLEWPLFRLLNIVIQVFEGC